MKLALIQSFLPSRSTESDAAVPDDDGDTEAVAHFQGESARALLPGPE